MKELVEKLKELNLTISSCESLTGGLFASSIVDISGASAIFKGGLVTYQDEIKSRLLDGKEILDNFGAVSSQMAYRMAKKAKELFNSDISVSFTGNAGPLPSENKPVGLVYSTIIIKDMVLGYEDMLKGTREEIRYQCILLAKERILKNLYKN